MIKIWLKDPNNFSLYTSSFLPATLTCLINIRFYNWWWLVFLVRNFIISWDVKNPWYHFHFKKWFASTAPEMCVICFVHNTVLPQLFIKNHLYAWYQLNSNKSSILVINYTVIINRWRTMEYVWVEKLTSA